MLNNKTVGYLTASVLLVFLLKAIPVCAGAAEIKIASWNIYWLTSEDPDHHRRKADDYTRLAGYANDLGADVIALQEVDAGFVRKVFPPQQYRIELSNRRDTRQRTGFAIRKGIRYRRLPDYRELSTKWGLRYGAVIELEVGGRKIDLMSVHLKSGCFDRDLDRPITASCRELKSQVRPLESWIDRRLERGRAFVLLGDFNRRMDRLERRSLALHCRWKSKADLPGQRRQEARSAGTAGSRNSSITLLSDRLPGKP